MGGFGKVASRVSVKQGATGNIDPAVSAEGSGFGGAASAWWQSHRDSFTCDGKRHVAWFTVDTLEPGSRGQLRSGWNNGRLRDFRLGGGLRLYDAASQGT